jgi:hypothetical protein
MLIYFLPMMAFVTLAGLTNLRPRLSSRLAYLASLLLLAVFAGIRSQTGQDWEAYENFFDNINIAANPFGEYFSSGTQPFEIGFYLLNFVGKLVWDDYHVVFITSSLFISFAIYAITPKNRLNYYYILAIYLSYSYLILNFAQVRQAIALSFTLIAFSVYSKSKNIVLALSISFFGALFQYSALMYATILPFAFHLDLKNKKVLIGIIISLILLCFALPYFNVFDLLSKIAFTNASLAKVEIYSDTQLDSNQGQALIYSLYLLVLAIYLHSRLNLTPKPVRPFINYALISIAFSIVFTIAFPGFYVLYSRIYVAASIFHALAIALVVATVGPSGKLMANLIFYISLLMAVTLYTKTILVNHEAYIPYLSIISNAL